MTPDDEARPLTREQFLANLRAMPSGPEYGRLADHDAELRASLAKCRKAARRLLNELPENMLIEYQDVAGVTNTRVLRLRIDEMCAALAATQDEEAGT